MIQEVNPTILYRAGKANEMADGLSRKPMTEWDKMLAAADPVDEDEPILVTRIKCDILDDVQTTQYTQSFVRATKAHSKRFKRPERFEIEYTAQLERDYDTVRLSQEKDPRILAMRQYLQDGTVTDEYRSYIEIENRFFEIYKNILWRTELQYPELRIVVPISERKILIQEHHDTPFAGHFGPKRTYGRMIHKYYWFGMRKD
ncbi:MAG: hypothetical protein GY738_28140, partial [Pseudoalteromonas sp.]|nr:hypothetical protein [Pseudoalteromonas sp.]